jgi:hypothetical protein
MAENAEDNGINVEREQALVKLANSGRSWKSLRNTLEFNLPSPLFDHPMEITVQMLRGLRMVDETIVVHGDISGRTRAGDQK